MRELKDGTYIIGVDHGYGNIKTANTVTPTGIQAYDTEPIFQGNVLEYGGKYYRFGEGHKNFIADKSEDDDFYILTLMAIARELQRAGICDANVFLAVGLPLKWVRTQRESFKKYLTKNSDLNFKFNEKEYHIHLTGAGVFPQGYSAIVEHLNEFRGTNILADIGNGTMNIMYINDKKPVETKCWTEKLGVEQCMIKAKNAVMDKYGVKIDESVIERYFRRGEADIFEGYISTIHEAVMSYINDVFSALKRYEYDPRTVRLHIIGGGGCIIKNFADYSTENTYINEDICATAKGYEALAYWYFKKAGRL